MTGESDSKRASEGCTWHCFRVQAGGRREQKAKRHGMLEKKLAGCLSLQHKGYGLQWTCRKVVAEVILFFPSSRSALNG